VGPAFRAVVRSEECVVGTPAEPGFHRARVGRHDVLVTRLPEGEAVAFAAICPHQETPLDSASFFEGKLRCGRHLYLYDVHTGENLLPSRTASPESLCRLKPGYLPVHRVEERDGWVWVADAPEPAPASYDPEAERAPVPQPGPAPAAPTAPPSPPPPAGPLAHPPEAVAARQGEPFDLVLPTAPKPAHLWRGTVPAALRVVSEGFAPDPPPRHIVRLEAMAPGRHEVAYVYATPWDPTPAETRTFVITVGP
jgi:nitrite reductase/ring-hydroxylating ferredoxin subunit/predicted secreted protein